VVPHPVMGLEPAPAPTSPPRMVVISFATMALPVSTAYSQVSHSGGSPLPHTSKAVAMHAESHSVVQQYSRPGVAHTSLTHASQPSVSGPPAEHTPWAQPLVMPPHQASQTVLT